MTDTADRAILSGSSPQYELRLRWWLEVVYVLGFYAIYSWVRNQFGSSGSFSASADRALVNAERMIDVERSMGLFFEERLQEIFLDLDWFLWFWNVFYGSLHFVVTAGVMVFLYRQFPRRYQRYRATLLGTTGLALIGFAAFPLMPPRLLNAGSPYGGDLADYRFVDTLAEVGGLWSFDSGTMTQLSNQWAAMPSLHLAWSVWCAMALYPVLRGRAAKVLIVAYPCVTLFAVVVTANHYWIDGLGGLIVLAIGYAIGHLSIEMIEERNVAQVLKRRLRRFSRTGLQGR